MILIIDNYDSFTYNLYQRIANITDEVKVIRNDRISVSEVKALNPKGIILSPGPGRPETAGICIELVRALHKEIPILGVCLGHQAITAAFGGNIINAKEIVHGKSASIFHNRSRLFENVPLPFKAARYHSLIADKKSLPAMMNIEAENNDGMIMAIKHQDYPTFGVQFHPESILSANGTTLLSNFLDICNDEVMPC